MDEHCPINENCEYWPNCLANLDSYGKCPNDKPENNWPDIPYQNNDD